MYGEVTLQNKKRFLKSVDLPREQVEKAMERALLRLERNAEKFGDKMVQATDGILGTNEKGFASKPARG